MSTCPRGDLACLRQRTARRSESPTTEVNPPRPPSGAKPSPPASTWLPSVSGPTTPTSDTTEPASSYPGPGHRDWRQPSRRSVRPRPPSPKRPRPAEEPPTSSPPTCPRCAKCTPWPPRSKSASTASTCSSTTPELSAKSYQPWRADPLAANGSCAAKWGSPAG